MNEKGFIKLNRKLLEWRYFKKDNYLKVWLYLLLNANHKNGMFEDKPVKRGQLITSVESISKGTDVSTQSVRTILKKLEGQELTIKSTNKYTLITILKYSDYQDYISNTNKQTNKQLTNNQQTTNKQLTTNNNVKNVKNERNNYLNINSKQNEININKRNIDKLPTYDTSKNVDVSKEQQEELLRLMGKESYESKNIQ